MTTNETVNICKDCQVVVTSKDVNGQLPVSVCPKCGELPQKKVKELTAKQWEARQKLFKTVSSTEPTVMTKKTQTLTKVKKIPKDAKVCGNCRLRLKHGKCPRAEWKSSEKNRLASLPTDPACDSFKSKWPKKPIKYINRTGNYFIKNPTSGKPKFIIKLLGDFLLKENHFVTDRKSREVFVFDKTNYKSSGDTYINEQCITELGEY